MKERRIPMGRNWEKEYYDQLLINLDLKVRFKILELEHENLKAKLEEQKELLKENEELTRKIALLAFPDTTKKMIELTQSIAKTIKESGIYE